MSFKSEYMLRLIRCGENLEETQRIVNGYKPKPVNENQSIFTPMSPDDYHVSGRLVQERESFHEQRERVARMVKQQRNAQSL